MSDSTEINTNSFGANTEDKVKEFQYIRGITIDGVVGPQTWGQLKLVTDPRSSGTGGGSSGAVPASNQAVSGICNSYKAFLVSTIDTYKTLRAGYDYWWPATNSTSDWRKSYRQNYVNNISALETVVKNLGDCSIGASQISTEFTGATRAMSILDSIINSIRNFR